MYYTAHIVCVFLLHFKIVKIQTEWVELPKIPATSSRDSLFRTTVTEFSPLFEQNSYRLPTTIIPKMVHTPIKYEDLEHIIGPGFEEELEHFYQKHRQENLAETSIAAIKPEHLSRGTKPNQILKQVQNHSSVLRKHDQLRIDDPWSIYDSQEDERVPILSYDPWRKYDKPLVQNERPPIEDDSNATLSDQLNFEDDFFTSKQHKVPNFNGIMDSEPEPIRTTEKNTDTTTKSSPKSKKRIIKIVKFVPKEDPSSSSVFGFANFIRFLKDIQSSFVSTTSRGIQDKIKMLESLKNKLLTNISECSNRIFVRNK